MDEDWETFRIDPIEFHDRRERVAVIGQVNARGRASSVEIEAIAGFVHELDQGRIKRVTSHSDVEAALEAMGLPELAKRGAAATAACPPRQRARLAVRPFVSGRRRAI
jgi:hypothetical protein